MRVLFIPFVFFLSLQQVKTPTTTNGRRTDTIGTVSMALLLKKPFDFLAFWATFKSLTND
jgi:hypothetical protein